MKELIHEEPPSTRMNERLSFGVGGFFCVWFLMTESGFLFLLLRLIFQEFS